ncbi:hypothetical protein [Shewanella aestuarii]|uniref:MYM-type domain-containing protein n=1 Tax=Shewanella aestuarii TaxID=1028752 RepID=A0A6G9QJ52_9GAMM|nr:hypothetical protein [Shewanella aestuarii]QIR14095.1 hypothetical protein HBH39_05990 [Shewanella aestuarii]
MSETQKLDFSAVNDTTLASFNQQKNLIKRMMKGNTAECSECKKPLTLVLPANGKNAKASDKLPGIYCAKGCTDIELDMEAVALLK